MLTLSLRSLLYLNFRVLEESRRLSVQDVALHYYNLFQTPPKVYEF